ncbi:hypothetical protein HETIRDRAFT_433543 [Heterobasidion irregulare TC 32-1]|uniref:Uncharacterized protein n=1 Tax=Heterobasidion irregulare (strain TC 32-1) TaxID=747525 RepID=W4K9P5_HETIT|nr:uncharacterized protein HETIRDRAFT_433543 [Heterobasidion irregulare TC 32-1]ETW82474.1 hypothetical protein HETIRDRAFT_433543 [Heterobasidion irregulare TC 32-1]
MSVLPRRTLDALAPPSTYVTRTLHERFTFTFAPLSPPRFPGSYSAVFPLGRLAGQGSTPSPHCSPYAHRAEHPPSHRLRRLRRPHPRRPLANITSRTTPRPRPLVARSSSTPTSRHAAPLYAAPFSSPFHHIASPPLRRTPTPPVSAHVTTPQTTLGHPPSGLQRSRSSSLSLDEMLLQVATDDRSHAGSPTGALLALSASAGAVLTEPKKIMDLRGHSR